MLRESKKLIADHIFLTLFFVWVVFGLIMLTSASAPLAYAQFGDTYYFIKRQIIFGLAPGLILFFVCLRVDYNWWKKSGWILYAISLILLILVFVPNVGVTINNARSWLGLFGYTFQPSELAKLSLIIMMSKLLSRDNSENKEKALFSTLIVAAPIILLVSLQPDVGTLSILLVIMFIVLFLAGIKKTHLAILGLISALIFILLLFMAPYRVQRLTTFLHPELDPKGVGYQINQAFLAIGSGGLWGLGLGHSRQKFQYLPEAHGDSIFAVTAEEMGFFISAAFIFLIIFLGLRGMKIAKFASDRFAYLLVNGIMVWFVWQSFLNIGSMVGVLPLTGVPLPFVSHGGSALMVALMGAGIAGRVSKQT